MPTLIIRFERAYKTTHCAPNLKLHNADFLSLFLFRVLNGLEVEIIDLYPRSRLVHAPYA